MGQQFRLPKFKSGEPLLEQLSADRLNEMLKAIEANRPVIGTNMTGQWTPSGTVLRAKPQITPGDIQANVYSFELEVDSVNREDGEVDIHVEYGEINGEPPDGMTGDDDYVLTISEDGTEIYAVVTLDADTLEITSRTLAFAAEVPDSTIDDTTITLYFPLGSVDFELGGDPPKIKNVFPHNRICGDINFAITYGSYNGAPSFWVVMNYSIVPLAIPS